MKKLSFLFPIVLVLAVSCNQKTADNQNVANRQQTQNEIAHILENNPSGLAQNTSNSTTPYLFLSATQQINLQSKGAVPSIQSKNKTISIPPPLAIKQNDSATVQKQIISPNPNDLQEGIDYLEQLANQKGLSLRAKDGQPCTVDTISTSNPCVFYNPVSEQNNKVRIAELTQIYNNFLSRASSTESLAGQINDSQLSPICKFISDIENGSAGLTLLEIAVIEEIQQGTDGTKIDQDIDKVNQTYSTIIAQYAQAQTYLDQQNARIKEQQEQANLIYDQGQRTLALSEISSLQSALFSLSDQVSNLNYNLSSLNSTISSFANNY